VPVSASLISTAEAEMHAAPRVASSVGGGPPAAWTEPFPDRP